MTKLADELRDNFPAGEEIGVRLSAPMFRRILSALEDREAAVTETHAAEGDVERMREALRYVESCIRDRAYFAAVTTINDALNGGNNGDAALRNTGETDRG